MSSGTNDLIVLSRRLHFEDDIDTMRVNLTPSVSLDFLDGYLFRLLQEIAADQGIEASGFHEYYSSRLMDKIGGLMEYEERLARYLLANFQHRHILHVGTGIGTLPCVLACNGISVTAIEGFRARVASARRIRAAVIDIWPEVAQRYDISEGSYPGVLATNSYSPESILVFTNIASSWTTEHQASIIESMQQFSVALLDLRLFGTVRNDERERRDLFDCIAATALSAERLPDIAERLDAHYARFVFRQ